MESLIPFLCSIYEIKVNRDISTLSDSLVIGIPTDSSLNFRPKLYSLRNYITKKLLSTALRNRAIDN